MSVVVRRVIACLDCRVDWEVDDPPACEDPSHRHRAFEVHRHRAAIALPDGTEVTAVSFDRDDAYRRDRPPDFGLYLDDHWDPPWPHEHVDWPDFGVPSDAAAVVAALRRLLDRARAGERVEVGCLGGHGRTGTALACLAVLTGVPGGNAVEWVRATYCDKAVETPEQAAFVAALEPPVSVRAATAADGPAWLELFERVAAEGRWLGSEPPIDESRFVPGIRGWVDDPHRDVLLAVAEARPVGWINVRLDRGTVDLGMGVVDGYRGRGVGTALMAAAVAWAEARGAERLTLEVFPHNEAALRLYKKFRFAETERRVGAHPRRSGEVWDGIVMARPVRIDWSAWHHEYDDPGSKLARRLAVVQGHIRRFLDGAPPGPVRVISMCAGEGRDLLGVLATHPRRVDVHARLVELDPDLAALARQAAVGLPYVDVVQGDAGTTSAYEGAVPADLLLVCGVFGNIADDDIHTTVSSLRSLAAPGATVIWTRHPRHAGVFDAICDRLAAEGFELVARDVPDDEAFGVGVHRLAVTPAPFRKDVPLFRFVSS